MSTILVKNKEQTHSGPILGLFFEIQIGILEQVTIACLHTQAALTATLIILHLFIFQIFMYI